MSARPKKIRYLWDRVMHPGHYVRCWKERGGVVVQVWLDKQTPEGEPDGDWMMPAVIGIDGAISQAIIQTNKANF